MDGLSLVEYADHESFMGRPGPALEAARRAVALYPGEGPLWAALARAWVAAGEPDSARTSLERGLTAGWRNPGERAAAERELAALRTPSGARPAPH
jgi:predicted Zn-dependent protease